MGNHETNESAHDKPKQDNHNNNNKYAFATISTRGV